jgi:glutathione-specific gamma-glutamylcyclotransferase
MNMEGLMTRIHDPYIHHPALRGKITDPLTSFFRNFKPSDLDARMKEIGRPDNWRHSDEELESARQTFLKGRLDQDLWVFAYGSLMWDPAFHFAEVRRGRVSGYARRFILKDTFGARGTPKAPGLMAALDEGLGCEGLVFRIAGSEAERESGMFWRRELIAYAYKPVFAKVETDFGEVDALTVIADRASEYICPDLSREEQVRYIATGTGFLGTSLQYIENIAGHFAALEVEDQEVKELLAGARAYASRRDAEPA